MSLTYIFGRSGYGKSEYIIDHALFEKRNKFILVPEQVNFEYEKKLIKRIPDTVSKNISILTFSSLARRVFYETGTRSLKPLSSGAKVMMIYKILKENAQVLTTIKSTAPAKGLINSVMLQIKEFKNSLITYDELFKLSKDLSRYPLLSQKLSDLALIYKGYCEHIMDRYKDNEDELMMVAGRLSESLVFKDSVIYIDSFTGFSLLEQKVIEALMKNGNDIYLSLTVDPVQMEDYCPVWEPVVKTVRKLSKTAQQYGIIINKPVYINKGRDMSSACLNHLENEMFSPKPIHYDRETHGINLAMLQNPFSEVEYAAKQIRQLVRTKGSRYRDISVIVPDIGSYEPVIHEIFDQYDIPYHFDEKLDMTLHPLPKYILGVLKAVSSGYQYEDMADIMKSEFSPLKTCDAELLENHILEKGIRGLMWHRVESFDDEFQNSRTALMNHISVLHDTVKNSKNGAQTALAVYKFITDSEIAKSASRINSGYEGSHGSISSNRLKQAYRILIDTLDEIHDIFGDTELSLIDLYRIVSSAVCAYSLATIPFGIDEIFIGTSGRSKKEDVKALFILGADDNAFITKTNSGILFSDIELSRISKTGFDKIKDPDDLTMENEYLLYTVLTRPKFILNVTAPMSDLTGKALGISSIFTRIRMIFPDLLVFSEEASGSGIIFDPSSEYTVRSLAKVISYGLRDKNLTDDKAGIYKQLFWFLKDRGSLELYEVMKKGFSYSNKTGRIDELTLGAMFSQRYSSSITRLQKYRMCPFSFIMQYGLEIRKRSVKEFTPADAGSFVHDVLEVFQNKLFSGLKEADPGQVENILSSAVDEVLERGSSKKMSTDALYPGIKSELVNKLNTVCRIIYENSINSSFRPFGFELKFGEGKTFLPIVINTKEGDELRFEGKIDRVDSFDKDGQTYYAVFDYKTGSKSFKLSDVFHGLDLQLVVYLDALLKDKEGSNAAGAFYFHVKDPIIKGTSDMSDQDIEREIRKQYKLSGMAIKDESILDCLDKADKNRGYYLTLPVNIDKNGFSRYSKVASEQQFYELFEYTEKLLLGLSKGSRSGSYPVKPVRYNMMTACDYCDYKKVCQFDLSIKQNCYDNLNSINDESFWEMIKKDE